MLEFGNINGVWEDNSLDNSQIQRGIQKLEMGVPVQVSEFDNHPAWLIKLNRVRKSDKWDSYNPQVQNLFLQTMEQSIGTIVSQNMPPTPGVMPGSPAGRPPPPPPAPPPSLNVIHHQGAPMMAAAAAGPSPPNQAPPPMAQGGP